MAALTYQDVLWIQNGTTSPTLDMSKPGVSVARRVVDFSGYSFGCFWTGSPQGTLGIQVCNASVLQDQLVPPAMWVALPSLVLTIGQGTTPATSPSLLEVTFGRAGWTSLIFTPASGSTGTLSSKFDGVRR